ncbi:hypothetical protein ABT025_18380 [Streptomyces sp. NPDC002809]|uniref:hypothetical protein n=1 Tax=Streptomyces sp. NPDC002809 TaxID=3154433 RepID=UPI003325B2B5
MALMDDIEFYGRAVDAGELNPSEAARLLADASDGGLTLHGAEDSIANWSGIRGEMESLHANTVDALRALRNGKPFPEHVRRNMQRNRFGAL